MRNLLPMLLVVSACAPEAAVECDAPGQICTVAGSGAPGFGGDGGDALEAKLYGPTDVVWLGTDDFVLLDWNNHKLRRVLDGTIETIVGRIHPLEGDGAAPPEGIDGPELGINHPVQAELAPDGQIYVAGWHNHRIYRWDPDSGKVTPVAGTVSGYTGDGGPADVARMAFPSSLAFEPDGAIVVVDQGNSTIRRIADGMIDTIAGTGQAGDSEGAVMETAFGFVEHPGMQNVPAGAIEVDDEGIAWVADSYNGRLLRVDFAAGVASTVVSGLADPRDVELGPDGRLFVLDTEHFEVVAFDRDTFEAEVVAGTGVSGVGDEGVSALESDLSRSHGIAFADDGALFIADTFNHRVRRIAPNW